VRSVVKAVDVPVTVKLALVGQTRKSTFWTLHGGCGGQMITVHARTRAQGYNGLASGSGLGVRKFYDPSDCQWGYFFSSGGEVSGANWC